MVILISSATGPPNICFCGVPCATTCAFATGNCAFATGTCACATGTCVCATATGTCATATGTCVCTGFAIATACTCVCTGFATAIGVCAGVCGGVGFEPNKESKNPPPAAGFATCVCS